ncbi:MAG TPA: outer membrane beta-barrel protein [Candidatus Cloacimonadota bacterium]|nr:outer membrane beta-barrel protein [Candidatus Cloacimonadota bacterium]HPT72821.1 outer membrane beta-barrel protein [Candidatus Cloacimonadota bacterium]
MKSHLLILIFLLFVCQTLMGVENGIMGGIGSVGYTGSDVINLESYGINIHDKMGFYASYFHFTDEKNNFQWRSELSITNRGAKLSGNFLGLAEIDGSNNLWYVGVPVTAILNVSHNANSRLYSGAGLSANFAISGNSESHSEGETYHSDMYDNMNVLTIGYQLCVGVNFTHSLMEIRYDRSLGHIFKDSGSDSESKSDSGLSVYNDAFWFLVGIKI